MLFFDFSLQLFVYFLLRLATSDCLCVLTLLMTFEHGPQGLATPSSDFCKEMVPVGLDNDANFVCKEYEEISTTSWTSGSVKCG